MATNRRIIGRLRELESLQDSLYSDESEFIAVYGRRRVGKTFLVNRAFQGGFAFQYTGLERKNNRQQLESFHMALKEQGMNNCERPKNWMEAFYLLQRFLQNKKTDTLNNNKHVVFLDEVPWMDAPKSGFVEALGNFWNRWAAWTGDMVLIICGSATSWMFNKVIKNHGGLYNRVTQTIALYPFTLGECEQFCQSRGLFWNRRQVTEAYMIIGGIPHYWNKFDKRESLPSNIDRLFFKKDADMAIEYDALFSSLFSKPESYEAIIDALALKKRGLTHSEISEVSGYTKSGKLTTILRNLELCGFIEKVTQPKRRNREAVYQLVDNFVIFHHEFIRKKEVNANYWSTHLLSSYHSAWSGLAFERVCFQHKNQIAKALGISGIYLGWYAWSAPANETYPGMQVDMVIDRADGVVNLCEAKFSANPFAISPDYMDELRLRQARYQSEVDPKKAVHLTMITANGVVQNPQKFEVNSFVALDDLFV